MGSFTPTLLRWFRQNGRELPWRGLHDPYAIWLSEVILQQTRIAQGRDYWLRFMRRWPTVQSLAAATEDDILREWQGLGYYSRARHLHEAARQIVELGHFPDTFEEIRRLKGVGDYTAAAIGSMAFGLPVAAVDGNVYRVLSRHFGIDTPINSTEGKHTFAALAQSLLPKDKPSEFNQAMMDFGALQCTPRVNPASDAPQGCLAKCPFVETCEAFRRGMTGQLPVKLKTVKVSSRRLTYLYIRYKGTIAIHRRGSGDIWQGLWEPLVLAEGLPIPEGARQGTWPNGRRLMKHVLTHRVILADYYVWEPGQRPTLPDGYRWIKEEETVSYGVPRLVELLLEGVEKEDRTR